MKVEDLKQLEGEDFDRAARAVALTLTPKDRRQWKAALVGAPKAVVDDWDNQSKLGFGQGPV